mmetsp:Transcript_60299/g.88318  ORF Transcript_60299/g.88318 Transcript_60299/m.88318 type:complete len:247 (+) Transcript_60299:1832-2572(+)
MQSESALVPRNLLVTSGPNRIQFAPRFAALATPGKSHGSAHMQSKKSASSMLSVFVGHCRRRLIVRKCCTLTPSRRYKPPCTTKTLPEITVAIGSTSKSWANIMKRFASYFCLTSSKNPPPFSNERRFISMFSWLPLLIVTKSGYSCLYSNVIIRISHACSPRSTTSPFNKYPVDREGSPFCLSTQRKSASCPCVSPRMTNLPSSHAGTLISQIELLRDSLKSLTLRPTNCITYLRCSGSCGRVLT